VIIRSATKEDVSAIMEIELESFEFGEVFPVRQFLYYLNMFKDGFFVVADASGLIVGYAILACTQNLGYILSIAVHPKNRKQGYASALLEVLDAKCREKGVSNLRLDVRVTNTAAIGLYKKMGLAELRVKKDFYGKGFDALSMGKTVSSRL
jgi:[ribosomal protein S18]-alanine N-acetyltransferase